MPKYVSERECEAITGYLLIEENRTKDACTMFNRSDGIIGKHARSDCSHDTVELAYKSDTVGWIVMGSGSTPSWGRSYRDEPVCTACGNAVESGACGFCERFDTVHGIERDELAEFGGGVIAD